LLAALIRNLRHITRHPFSRGRKIDAARRFVRWQVSSRLALGPTLVPFVDSLRLCVANGMTGATGNIYTGLAEFDDMALVLHVLRPGDLFVDIGANIGSYTILAAAAGAHAIAFEPVPTTYEALALNVRLNDLGGSVITNRAAVGATAGSIRFTANHDTVNHVATADEVEGTVEVPVVTLDEALARVSAEVPMLIKIDVEGYETEALAGATRTLASPGLRAVIMELNGNGARYGFDDDALHQTMLDYGFQPFSYDAMTRKLSSLPGRNRAEGNTIYLRDIQMVESRIATARRFGVQGKSI
jgi:FkbM family methyltransferase